MPVNITIHVKIDFTIDKEFRKSWSESWEYENWFDLEIPMDKINITL